MSLMTTNLGHLLWISRLLIKALAASLFSSLTIEPRIYITGPVCPLPDLSSLEEEVSAEDSTEGAVNVNASSAPSPTTEEAEDKEGPPLYSALKVTHGRPSITRLLRDEISTAEGPVSVDGEHSLLGSLKLTWFGSLFLEVAGPAALAESVRWALTKGEFGPLGVLKGAPPVTLHVETFGM